MGQIHFVFHILAKYAGLTELPKAIGWRSVSIYIGFMEVRPVKEPKDTEVRRSEFVEAAEKLFRENGIVDTTVNSIVRELDVAKGLFYYYFKSKDDVIDAISNDRSPYVTAEDGRRALELVLAIYKSAATGQPVYFE